MPTPADYARAKVDRARAKIDTGKAFREFTVAVRAQAFPGAIAEGVGPPTNTDLVLAPRPKVVALGEEAASWFAVGGPLNRTTGAMAPLVYQVSQITPAYDIGTAAGGYTVAQLLPGGASPQARSVWWLQGPGLRAGGEPFVVAKFVESLLEYVVTVARTADI
jgi:hypothetical protein